MRLFGWFSNFVKRRMRVRACDCEWQLFAATPKKNLWSNRFKEKRLLLNLLKLFFLCMWWSLWKPADTQLKNPFLWCVPWKILPWKNNYWFFFICFNLFTRTYIWKKSRLLYVLLKLSSSPFENDVNLQWIWSILMLSIIPSPLTIRTFEAAAGKQDWKSIGKGH